jgi:hypothetical protein
VQVDQAYLTFTFGDGRDGGLAHAYAITAHKAEGATLPTARAVAAEDTSRAGLYVMLSRARHDLRGYLITRTQLEPADEETWLPVLEPAAGPLARLADRLEASQPERLATDHDPAAVAAHQLRSRRTLAELAGRDVHTGQSPAADPALCRRAVLAADAALAALAVTDPPPALVARIGADPTTAPTAAAGTAPSRRSPATTPATTRPHRRTSSAPNRRPAPTTPTPAPGSSATATPVSSPTPTPTGTAANGRRPPCTGHRRHPRPARPRLDPRRPGRRTRQPPRRRS